MIKCDPEEKRVRVGLRGGGRPNESEVFM